MEMDKDYEGYDDNGNGLHEYENNRTDDGVQIDEDDNETDEDENDMDGDDNDTDGDDNETDEDDSDDDGRNDLVTK